MVAMVAMVIKVAMVIMVRTGQDRTKLTFKLDFPGNMCWAAFAILAMFDLYLSCLVGLQADADFRRCV